jgi:transcriptional regulator
MIRPVFMRVNARCAHHLRPPTDKSGEPVVFGTWRQPFPRHSRLTCCFPKRAGFIEWNRSGSLTKRDVQQGTVALMVLKTLDVLGPLHGYGIARRIEQISHDLLAVNQGTLYPVLLKLEQEGAIASEWGASDNNRRARFYRLTSNGRRRLRTEATEWAETTALMDRFMTLKAGDLP